MCSTLCLHDFASNLPCLRLTPFWFNLNRIDEIRLPWYCEPSLRY